MGAQPRGYARLFTPALVSDARCKDCAVDVLCVEC